MEPERFYDAVVEEYDRTNAMEELPESYTELLGTFSQKVDGGKILDAGCGPGRDTEYFTEQGYDAVGVDLSKEMIEYASERREGKYVRADLRDLPFEDGAFDGVWCNAAVFLLEPGAMADAVDELARVTADDGLAHISFKLGEGELEKEMDGNAVEQYLVAEADARAMLEDAGYGIQEFQRHGMPGGFAFGNYVLER